MSIQVIDGLGQLAANYDALICDVWGVVHNGREAFEPAWQALRRFREGGGVVVLVSNAPRPAESFTDQLRMLGVPDDAWTAVVTSGDATRSLLKARASGPVWALGPARDASLYEGIDLEFTETAAGARFICCSGLFDDETETPEDYRERLVAPARGGVEMICANPDIVVQRGDQMIYCAGALARLYAELGGPVIMAGKPHAPIYDLARAEIKRANQSAIRLLAIGDGAPTDLKGANDQGLDALFILGGIHAAQLCDSVGAPSPERISDFLRAQGVHADYALGGLRW